MKKILKYVLLVLGGLVLVVVAAVTYVLLTFDPNHYKPQIIKVVKEKTHRDLKLAGDIKLTVFPSIGATINKISLSERGSKRQFAAVDSAHVSLALLPLLSRHVVVNGLALSGAKVDLVKYRNGKLNIDDLISAGAKTAAGKPAPVPAAPKAESAGGTPLALDIASISVDNTALSYHDEQTGAKYAVKNLHVSAGRIASGVPSKVEIGLTVEGNKPKVDVTAQLKATLTLDLEKQLFSAEGMDLQAKGEAAGISNLNLAVSGDVSADMGNKQIGAKQLTVKVSGVQAGNSFAANISLPGVETKNQVFKIRDLVLDAEMEQPQQAFKVKLNTPVEGNLETQRFDLSGLKLALNATGDALPNKSVSSELGGDVHMDLKRQAISVKLAGGLLQSKLKAEASVNDFAHPAIRFKADIDQFDADLYLPKKSKEAAPAAESGKAAPEQPFDLSGLRGLDVDGSLTLGALKVVNIKASKLRVNVKAKNGEVDVPMSLNLYKGSAKLDAKVNAVPAKPAFAIKGNLSAVDVGPLAKDAADLDLVEGRGNIALNLTTQGNLVSALKKGLNGTMGVNLKNGAVKGINLQKLVQGLQQLSKKTRAANVGVGKDEKTAFTEFRANFKVRNGVAHNDDLSIKAPPTVHVTGNGDIDIGNSTINYTTKVIFSKTEHGGSGTLPVYLSGPFTDLKYRVDVGALAASVVKQKVKAKVEAKKEQAREKLKSKAQEELKRGFKSLFK